jgi:hypothetical protein
LSPRTLLPLGLLVFGIAAWGFAVSRLSPSAIGVYGLLLSAGPWFSLGLAALVLGFVLELCRREYRGWLLLLFLVALIVAIHAAVPIIYRGVPEYAWVYKHVGVVETLAHSGRIVDPTDIYQLWPGFFAAVAAVAVLAGVDSLSFAAWAPVAFELADALVLLGVFILLARNRRVGFLAVLLHVCLVSWVGQNYLSPQAFAYLLWLGIVLAFARWLRAPLPRPPARHARPLGGSRGRHARPRDPLLIGLDAPPETTSLLRTFGVVAVAFLFAAIVPAHQLTPFMVLAGLGGLTVFNLLRPRWLLVVLAGIAGAYLLSRYGFIAHALGGLLGRLNPFHNALGVGLYRAGPQAVTAWCVRGLALGSWLLALVAVFRWRRTPGRVAIPAVLAFSPFLILLVQDYGGEAIYRVFLFSAPWCALLIAVLVSDVRAPVRRWVALTVICVAALLLGLQGLYGPARVNGFTSAELAASLWLYGHVPPGSLIVLPVDNFPIREIADYGAYDVRNMPSDVRLGEQAWLDQADLSQVDDWVAGLGHRTAYVVVSRGMHRWAEYYGSPRGFQDMVRKVPRAPRWGVIYRNDDVTIYRLDPP